MGPMGWLRGVGVALLATTMTATGETNTTTTSMTPSMADRVVMLTPNRSDSTVWCMGLLIAPRAVLTYAHCIQKPLTWAFFGSSKTEYFQWDVPKTDGDVGDMEPWVSIVQTIVHPNYTADGSNPTTDLAVLQLQEPRVTTDAFSLVANMAELDSANVLDLEAFQMSNSFVLTSRDTKLRDRGTFRKVPWTYCMATSPGKLVTPWKVFVSQPKGQVCVVASVVEDRRYEQLTNTFVLMDDKLVGLSVVSNSTVAAAHRFIFLSDQAAFINEATRKTETTQKTNVWKAIAQSSFVVGGKDTPTFQGYIAGLRESKSGTNFCLGSLIAPKFVLTAAHCVDGVNFTQMSVGSMYVSTEVDGEQIKVKRVIVHPNYDKPTFRNDYAIVELEYISIQSPILLYSGTGAETAPGERLTFYGYGPSSGNTPGKLQSVDLPVVDKKQCKAVLQPPVLDDTMMCAGGEEGKDACQGDSGGPLVYQAKSPTSLVAMSSYGRGCATKGMPAVYAVVATASSFIDKYVDGHRWITAYGTSDSSRGQSATPTPVVTVNDTPAPTRTQLTPSSTPAMTHLQEPRSGEEIATPAPVPTPPDSSKILNKIDTEGGWTLVPTLSLQDTSSSSLIIGAGYSQLTRDVLSSSVLTPRSGWSSVDQLPLAGAKTVTFYSTGDLSHIASLISTFESSPLRRRPTRFKPGETTTCAGHR